MKQKSQILNHLINHKYIDSLSCFNMYGCMRLASYIHTLRQEGYNIESIQMNNNDKHWVKYVLHNENTYKYT